MKFWTATVVCYLALGLAIIIALVVVKPFKPGKGFANRVPQGIMQTIK